MLSLGQSHPGRIPQTGPDGCSYESAMLAKYNQMGQNIIACASSLAEEHGGGGTQTNQWPTLWANRYLAVCILKFEPALGHDKRQCGILCMRLPNIKPRPRAFQEDFHTPYQAGPTTGSSINIDTALELLR